MGDARARINLALSILNNATGHEARAVSEALLALEGATVDDLLELRWLATVEGGA